MYDWIASNVPSTLIYRFYPAGEKKLSNLSLSSHHALTTEETVRCIPILCQDQELLHYDYYKLSWQSIKDICQSRWPENNDYQIFDQNQAWWEYLKDHNIASVVFGNINAITSDKVVLLHSEKRSLELEKFHHIAVGAFWWSHGMIARDWYRYAQHDHRLQYKHETYSKDFNIYSRAWTGSREYRLVFLDQLVEHGIDQSCRITFSRQDNEINYQDYKFINTKFKLNNELDHLPNNSISSNSSATYDYQHYQSCAIDVVLETLFDDTRLHLTEKILRPIACAKPFVLVSTHGSLEYLKNYGFETFGDYIDESYDQMQDPIERIHLIIKEMKRISGMNQTEKQHLWSKLHTIAKRNQTRFFSDRFGVDITKELVDNVTRAMDQIRLSHTGKRWAQQRRVLPYQQRRDSLNYDPANTKQFRSILARHLRSRS